MAGHRSAIAFRRRLTECQRLYRYGSWLDEVGGRVETMRAEMAGTAGRLELALAGQFRNGIARTPSPLAAAPDIHDMTPREMSDYGFRLFGEGAIDIHTLHRFRRELVTTDGTPAADIKMDFAAQARERLAHLDAVFEPKSSTSYRSLRRLLDFARS